MADHPRNIFVEDNGCVISIYETRFNFGGNCDRTAAAVAEAAIKHAVNQTIAHHPNQANTQTQAKLEETTRDKHRLEQEAIRLKRQIERLQRRVEQLEEPAS